MPSLRCAERDKDEQKAEPGEGRGGGEEEEEEVVTEGRRVMERGEAEKMADR